jgi:hypothetical protein
LARFRQHRGSTVKPPHSKSESGDWSEVLWSSSSSPAGSAGISRISESANPLRITNGEVNFTRGFINAGSIDANRWRQMMGSWGYCERHAWVALSVEMSFLHGFCLRSTDLYVHLLKRAIAALAPGASGRRRTARRLANQHRCLICEADPRRRGLSTDAELVKGKDQSRLRMFAEAVTPLWQNNRCPCCTDAGAHGRLCRRHLIEAIKAKSPIDLAGEHLYLSNLLPRLEKYKKSFAWGHRGSDGPEDRAAFLSVVGWCSGWASLGKVLDKHRAATS